MRRTALVLLPWLVIVGCWYAVHYSGAINPALVPAPHAVFTRLIALMGASPAPRHPDVDAARVHRRDARHRARGAGRVRARLVPGRAHFIDPLINFFRALPPIALIPLVIVYFGVDETAKIVILFYASFFAGVIVMYEGIAQISPIYVRVARTLGATDGEIFRKVIVPLTVPHMLTALRVALGVAWATLVASELIAAQQGLGALIQNAASFFQLDIIYVGIICIGFIALAMDVALRAGAAARGVAGAHRMTPRARIASSTSRSSSPPPTGRFGGRRRLLRHPRPRVRLGHRALGLRQDDHDEHGRRVPATRLGARAARRQARYRARARTAA